MRHILASRYFLIITALFLAVTMTIIWFFFPPVLKTFKDIRVTTNSLTDQIETSQIDGVRAKDLVVEEATLASLYDKASLALPSSPSADLLLLQLDGLTKSLGLDATITVPFSSTSLANQVAAPAAPTNDNDIKPGSGSTGGSQPIINPSGTGTNTDWSLTGDWDYPTTLNLLTKLKTFSRWNAVTSIDLTSTAEKSTTTISGKVYWTPTANLQLTGSAQDLLDKAKTLFDSYQSYATVPDVTKEGNFGKTNPFLP